MVKKFTIPFASQGDANDIPDALQVDGKVSFTQGFSYDYERPYDDPQAKDIAREDMNGIFKAITSAVGELQTLGASEWSSAISYQKGAIVYYEKDLYISQIDDNQNTPPQNWVSITSIANDSLKKAANLSDLTNKTTARNNLGLGSSATLNKTDVLGTSTSLVATQKLVNDTKINLENSKQDKLTFSGTGNVARMSEVDKKRNTSDLDFNGVLSSTGGTFRNGLRMINPGSSSDNALIYKGMNGDKVWLAFHKDGELTWESPITTEKTGSGLGVGQKWVDVTSQRAAGTTYTNNTGKPVMVITANKADSSGGQDTIATVDGVSFAVAAGAGGTNNAATGAFVVPIGASYSVKFNYGSKSSWVELR